MIGIRAQGQSHIAEYLKLQNIRVTAICDVDTNLFKERIKRHFTDQSLPEPKTYVDLRKLYEDKDIDAVSIATPNHWHALGTIWAIQGGKDVVELELPLSGPAGKVIRLVAAPRRRPGGEFETVTMVVKDITGEKVLARKEPVTSDSEFYPLPYNGPGSWGMGKPIKSITHPLRPDLPIFIGAEGPKNVAQTAQIADGWLPLLKRIRDGGNPLDASAVHPEAYPLVLRINPGMAVRPPLAWELELLEGCLRAIPKFLVRDKRTPARMPLPISSGELTLELLWPE